jgi:dUTP pyrophosphatase
MESVIELLNAKSVVESTSNPPLNRATSGSAGHELCTTEDIRLLSGERILYPTGVVLSLKKDEYMMIRSRSSIAMRGVDVAAGVIDSDYRGIIQVLLANNGPRTFEAKAGDSIAQGIVMKYEVLSGSGVIKDDVFEHKGFGSTSQ